MKIEFTKLNHQTHSLKIVRDNTSFEEIVLDTKTYFLHDICHFCVEKTLNFQEGFWVMLAQGYKINQLKGKENELTEQLRYRTCLQLKLESFLL